MKGDNIEFTLGTNPLPITPVMMTEAEKNNIVFQGW